ncbi:MAG: HAMP domain-containing histidine kinase, partial [Bacteroidia bacterium]|nr:HAMP domain-containing histidine kinase [Bacteroidia bacterium]
HNVFKDKVFTIIAHDLRAPVANLKNIFNLLDDELISDEEFIYLKKSLNDQVSSLSLLLDNLLLWARNQMESGFVTNKTAVSVNKLIERNKLLFTEIANKKEVTIESKIEDDITLNADADQLDLIVRNLISNAIKFTHQNGIVSISASQTKESVIFKIKDNGIGMNQETIESIYNNQVVSKQGTGGEKGTGLGINLTSEFIESNNGIFTIKSEPEIGTEITIEFKKTNV